MPALSILIPARNEPYLQKTVDDILTHSEADTEVLVGMDGQWVNMNPDPRLEVVFEATSIGQRAITNKLAKRASGRYVMKVDAHCSFSQGFDRIMLESMDDRTIMAPYLLALDVEKWEPRPKPTSSAYYFDTNFVFQYHRNAENLEPLNETMCLQGSAWMVSRENYWKWNLCDESYGSWGSQGVELGIQAWLNGGRCVTNKNTYYAHLFRESDADFPYERDHVQLRKAHNLIKERFIGNERVLELAKKFNAPGW